MQWTMVQHTGFTGGGNPQFEQSVEKRSVRGAKVIAAIKAAGGVVFDDYLEADAFEDAANYPPGVSGLIPQAAGRFTNIKNFPEPVYVPVRAVQH